MAAATSSRGRFGFTLVIESGITVEDRTMESRGIVTVVWWTAHSRFGIHNCWIGRTRIGNLGGGLGFMLVTESGITVAGLFCQGKYLSNIEIM